MAALEERGIQWTHVTLHVGYGTFDPIRCDSVEEHRVGIERFDITDAAARVVNRALDDGRRVVAVGTTTTRVLETAALRGAGRLRAGSGETDLYIRPGHDFQVVGRPAHQLPSTDVVVAGARCGVRGPGLDSCRPIERPRHIGTASTAMGMRCLVF